MLEAVEPLIIASARKHGIADDDILHAFNHPISYEDLERRLRDAHWPHPLRPLDRTRVYRHRPWTGHRACDDGAQEVLEVMTMPRSLQEILEHADELERRFADHEPADVRAAAPLHALRDAVTERAATERRIADAVTAARQAGVSWSAIGGMLGTSGEAARKRYAVSIKTA
jgi:hypothetical protein